MGAAQEPFHLNNTREALPGGHYNRTRPSPGPLHKRLRQLVTSPLSVGSPDVHRLVTLPLALGAL
eukprot:8187870-Pyramimonas_sp.AAC.1